jgi:phage terminase small subunit
MWGVMRDRLERLRVWSDQYAETLAQYCLLWSRLVRYEGGNPDGLTFNQWDKLLNQVIKYQREFGCTPASKTMLRVNDGEGQKSDPKGKYGVVG